MDEKLLEIKTKVDALASIIGAAPAMLPTYRYSEHTGRPHIEVDAQGYHFVAYERGTEVAHEICTELDDLMYRIFEGVTFELAMRYELAHRIESQDCRRIMFQHQVELLSRLSAQWASREAQEQLEILKQHPFNDQIDP